MVQLSGSKCREIFALFVVVSVALTVVGCRSLGAGPRQPSLNSILPGAKLVHLDPTEVRASILRGDVIRIDAPGGPLAIRAAPVAVTTSDAELIEVIDGVLTRTPVLRSVTFAGYLIDDQQGSEVRLTSEGSYLSGYVLSESDSWFIEPAVRFLPGSSDRDFVVYRPRDLRIRIPLENDTPPQNPPPQQTPALEPVATATGGPSQVGIILVSDPEYRRQVEFWGNDTLLEQLAFLNEINGIYKRTVGFEFVAKYFFLAFPGVLTAKDCDPLLAQLKTLIDQTWGNLDDPAVRRSLGVEVAHLTTGKDLKGDLRGCAWERGAYGFAEHRLLWIGGGGGFGGPPNLAYLNLLTSAHEIGHNFDGDHGEADEWCVRRFIFCLDRVRTIMWKTLYGDNRDYFSSGQRRKSHDNRGRIIRNAATR